ncbi:MAG: hypothetical protein EZS28_029539 [Streblomastix strix]|uniref:Uncharacterized protein n=1 Tax=Streblomastix strix TaxID=222440 RepID=A0A5J4UXC9_9EUKA|nr:MAG: hypothetical protein EZS28_029539 [Streblomastix strix]
MMRLIYVCNARFWNGDLGEIPDATDDEGKQIFTILTAKDIEKAQKKRAQQTKQEQQQYDEVMAKKRVRKEPKFSEGKTLENAILASYKFKNDLDDYVIEDE